MVNWEVKKLGEVCETGSGGTPLKAHKDYYENGNIPWLLSGEVSQGEIFEAKNFITEKGFKNSSAKLFPKDTVLVAMYGATAGQVGILRFEATTNQAVCGILPNDKTIPEYLYYCFLSKKDELISQAVGGAQPNISQIKIRNTEIPLPPLEEQQRIVEILDKAFKNIEKAKENAEKNFKNARQLFESYLNSVFKNGGADWEEKTLGEICKTTQGVQIPKNFQSSSLQGNFKRYLYISDFDHEKNLKYVEDKYPSKIVTPKDLIVANTGASAGRIFRGIDGILSNNLFKVSFSDRVLNSDFLYYFVTSELFKSYQKSIIRGTANPHMGHENFNSTMINLPPLKAQESIVAKLDELSVKTKKLEDIYRRKLSALDALKRALLEQAFKGELLPQRHEPAEVETF